MPRTLRLLRDDVARGDFPHPRLIRQSRAGQPAIIVFDQPLSWRQVRGVRRLRDALYVVSESRRAVILWSPHEQELYNDRPLLDTLQQYLQPKLTAMDVTVVEAHSVLATNTRVILELDAAPARILDWVAVTQERAVRFSEDVAAFALLQPMRTKGIELRLPGGIALSSVSGRTRADIIDLVDACAQGLDTHVNNLTFLSINV